MLDFRGKKLGVLPIFTIPVNEKSSRQKGTFFSKWNVQQRVCPADLQSTSKIGERRHIGKSFECPPARLEGNLLNKSSKTTEQSSSSISLRIRLC